MTFDKWSKEQTVYIYHVIVNYVTAFIALKDTVPTFMKCISVKTQKAATYYI